MKALPSALAAVSILLPLAGSPARALGFDATYCRATVQFKITSLSGPNAGMVVNTGPIELTSGNLSDAGATTVQFPALNRVRIDATWTVADTPAADRNHQCPADGTLQWLSSSNAWVGDRSFDRARQFTRTASVTTFLQLKMPNAFVSTPLYRVTAVWTTAYSMVARRLVIVQRGAASGNGSLNFPSNP